MAEGYEPKLLYVLCSWCGSGGSESARAHGLKYPANVLLYRVNCTGSLPAVHILRALLEGADGVAVSGCHPGDCHYEEGNYHARRRIALAKSILDALDLGEDRLWFRFVAHGEGRRFVDTAAEFNEHLKGIGPNPLNGITTT
ncbi:MAG: hydrogenase iron-sulfur subunit [Candidatus Zixiibacteriota bacterium]|jgi:F420-non-reducing hydrogenase iron-sulfur subunit